MKTCLFGEKTIRWTVHLYECSVKTHFGENPLQWKPTSVKTHLTDLCTTPLVKASMYHLLSILKFCYSIGWHFCMLAKFKFSCVSMLKLDKLARLILAGWNLWSIKSKQNRIGSNYLKYNKKIKLCNLGNLKKFNFLTNWQL